MPTTTESIPAPPEKNGTTGPAKDDLEVRVEASRAARLARSRADDEIKRRRMLEEEIKLEEIEAREGLVDKDIKPIFSPVDGAMVVVRKPAPAVWQPFESKVLANKVAVADLHEIVRRCLVYPDKATFQQICDMAPGMLGSAANAVAGLAGMGTDGLAGK